MYYIMNVAAGLQWPGAGFASTTERWSRASVAFTFFYYSSLWSIKIAFLLFFKRLGTNVMHQKKIWWTIFVFTIATYFVCIGITEYACRVRSFEYIVANCRKPRKTFASRLTIQLNCAWDVLTDFLSKVSEPSCESANTFTVMIIPIRMLWGVQMKWRRKLALAGIFSLVIITISTSIIRASVVSSEAPRVIDTSWLYMWSAIEISVGKLDICLCNMNFSDNFVYLAIVVACLASFRNLFSRQTSRQNPKRYEPSDRSNLFLQGGKSRRRIRTLIDVLVSTSDDPHSSDQVHIEDGMNTRNSDHDTHDQIQLQKAVHVRKDIHLVDDVV
jgi:hypothetical protein